MVKKVILLSTLMIVSYGTVYPQTESTTNKDDSILFCNKCDSLYNKICLPNIFGHPEKSPEFPGGMEEMLKFIVENFKYPAKCKEEDSIQERIIVKFIIDESGKVICPRIIKSLYREADEEALRVIGLMPDWEPASNNEIPVKSCYTVPVRFKLDTDSGGKSNFIKRIFKKIFGQ